MPNRRLAKVIDSGPYKIAKHIAQPVRGTPTIVGFDGKGLRAHHDPIWKPLVIYFILLPLVVVPAHIQMQESRIIGLPLGQVVVVWPRDRHDDRPYRVDTLHRVPEFFGDGHSCRFPPAIDLVADAPENDAGMISIPHQHALEISFPPVLEIEMIVVDIFAEVPAIKRFIDNHHPQPVTCVEKGGRGRVMTGSNSIESVGLQYLYTPLLCPVECGGAENAVIVVHAAAFKLHLLPVDAQAMLDIDLDTANAKSSGGAVDRFPGHHKLDFGPVQLRR